MRDENDGGAGLGAQLAHQVQNLRLDRHVEGRGRFVGDEQLGLAGQRHRNHDALGHAAGNLVRVALEAALRVSDAHGAQQFDRLRLRLFFCQRLMGHQRLGNLVADAKDRVETARRLLEDHRNVVAADIEHHRIAGAGQVAFLEENLPLDDLARSRQQAHDRKRSHALAAARLTDNAQHLAGRYGEVDAVDRLHHTIFGVEVGFQPLHLEDGLLCWGRTVRCCHTDYASWRCEKSDTFVATFPDSDRIRECPIGTSTASTADPAHRADRRR